MNFLTPDTTQRQRPESLLLGATFFDSNLPSSEVGTVMHAQALVSSSDIAEWRWETSTQGGVRTVAAIYERTRMDGVGEILGIRELRTLSATAVPDKIEHQIILATSAGRVCVRNGAAESLFNFLQSSERLVAALEEGILQEQVRPLAVQQIATSTSILDLRRYRLGDGYAEVEILLQRNMADEVVGRFYVNSEIPESGVLEVRSVKLNPIADLIRQEIHW